MDLPTRSKRRSLSFHDISQVIPEVHRVRPAHRTVGQWTLGQICRHLADTINGSIDGFDLSRHRFKRFFLRRLLLRYTFRWGIPENYSVDPSLDPPPGVDLGQGIDALRRAVDRYQAHRGMLHPHPLFGRLSRESWDRLHRVHCAHHLSFVIPDEP